MHINISKKLRKEFIKICPLFKGTLSYSKIIEILTPVLKKFRAKPLMMLGNISNIDCSIGGVYDSDATRIPITIELLFSANSDKIKFTKKSWDTFLFDIFEIMLHEHVHLHQRTSRQYEEFTFFQPLNCKTRMSENQEYLAELDEIDAYGLCIALEILYQFPKDEPFKLLDSINKNPTLTYGMYQSGFVDTDWTDIRRMLLKKTYKWLVLVVDNDWGYVSQKI